MPALLDIVAANGTPFRVAYLAPGEHLTNTFRVSTEHSVVEFYDRRFDPREDGHGQFTGGYYRVSTILGIDEWSRALCLDGGQRDVWTVDAATMDMVRAWLEQHERAADKKVTRTV